MEKRFYEIVFCWIRIHFCINLIQILIETEKKSRAPNYFIVKIDGPPSPQKKLILLVFINFLILIIISACSLMNINMSKELFSADNFRIGNL